MGWLVVFYSTAGLVELALLEIVAGDWVWSGWVTVFVEFGLV